MRVRGLGALLLLAGCAAPPVVVPETASLVLRLDALRRLQFAGEATGYKVQITGPDLDAPFEDDLDPGKPGEALSVKQVPIGKLRLVTLVGLDLNQRPVPGAVYRTVGDINRGPNTLEISRLTTVEGDVLAGMLVLDKQFGTQVTRQATSQALADAVAGYLRALRAPDPALLDAGAIADAIYHGNGVAPVAQPAFVRKGATLVLRPTGWPPGMSATATVDDTLSQPIAMDDGGVHVLGPIAPGTWSLTITPGPGLTPLKIPVVAKPGDTLQIPISFGTGQKLDDLPRPVGATAYGTLPIGTKPTLVTIGGVTSTAEGGPEHLAGLSYRKDAGWTVGAVLDRAVLQAAVTTWEGRLYWFGGLVDGAPTGEIQVFSPANPVRPGGFGVLPGNRKAWGAAAGTIKDVIYVTGGTAGMAPSKQTLAFDPFTDTFSATAQADLPSARADMASVVLDGKLYVFGGLVPLGAAFDVAISDAIGDANAFTPDAKAGIWAALPPMPTARSGAAALAVNGNIWVIGGATRFGTPTGAVEVYNPVANSWSVRAPLQVGRAFPAVAWLDGKIVVAGGILGPTPLTDLPTAAVEALTP
ncbi:MAG: Kelch repeat-containing protein [Cyanobacteria bacterium RYN_339]|nr:Kelch repeat-containing protein [Cyanobacteria bacterium RYN_339]